MQGYKTNRIGPGQRRATHRERDSSGGTRCTPGGGQDGCGTDRARAEKYGAHHPGDVPGLAGVAGRQISPGQRATQAVGSVVVE